MEMPATGFLIGTPASIKAKEEERATVDSADTEESISPFGKSLGGNTIAFVGSETDASVKAILSELGNPEEGGRQPASLQNSEIGSQEGPTLFERCHATHKRCAKSGCVTVARKERAGG